MHRLIKYGAALAASVALLVLTTGPSLAAPPNTPGGRITDVRTKPGLLQFVFAVDGLPRGTTLNGNSLVVTAGGRRLATTVVPVGREVGPTQSSVREAVLVLDTSGSMAGDGIAAARAAALNYARGLPADVSIGLVTFSDTPHVLLRPTTDRGQLSKAIAQAKAGGGTALYDGLIVAAGLMSGLPANADRRLLVLSDGDDTSSIHGLAEATRALVAAGVAADVVAFRLPGNQDVLDRLASASHGKVTSARNASDLARAFTVAAQAFGQQLLVTARVPAALANSEADITATANAGNVRVAATARLKLAAVSSAANHPKPSVSASAPANGSSARLWTTLLISFVALFALMLMALFVPVLRHEGAAKRARIAEAMRYRVVGAVGPSTPVSAAEPPSRSAFGRVLLSAVDKTMRSRGRRTVLAADLDRAGLRLRPEEWAVMQLLAVLLPAAILGLVASSVIGVVVGAAAGWLGARFFIRYKMARRAASFERQLPDTLQFMASSLRSGFSLNQSLASVTREGTEPTAGEFARALTEVRLGAELEDALEDIADRMRCEDLRWVVQAIRISREVGGNLAEVLGTTVTTMRQRVELRGHVKALSAEGRISARVLTGLPFFILAYFAVVNPSYLRPLFHTGVGIGLLAVGAVLLTLGSFWLSRLVKIKV